MANAKRDIPLYFKDFKDFWDASVHYFSDDDLLLCYSNTLIFKNWKIALNHLGIQNLNSILNEIHEDINASFFYAFFGQYRSAHMHLRSVIELSLQLLYFYQHEVEFSLWKKAEFRIKHEDLSSYLKKHPNLIETSAVNLIDTIAYKWKLFSKYIHAETLSFFQTALQSSQTKTISAADFGKWKSSFLGTGYYVNKLFLLFFRDKLNAFPTQAREILLRNIKDEDMGELGFRVA